MFRGQPKAWPLLPTIGRWPQASKGTEDWRVFQEVVLNDFAKFASPYLPNPPINEVDWLVLPEILFSGTQQSLQVGRNMKASPCHSSEPLSWMPESASVPCMRCNAETQLVSGGRRC